MASNPKNYEIDFTKGKILIPLFIFALPLMLSGMLQLFYNAADIIVVGRFAGKESLAAVGSTSALINLLTNAFLGLAVGANVIVAKGFGTNDSELIHNAVHTSVTVAVIGGVIFGATGFIFARPLLLLMGSPEDVIYKSTLYMKIYFAGLPAMAVYNFGSAILRAVGDTKRPLFFLVISGFINIILNLIFVIAFKMDVAGVALATIISQIVSAALIIICLIKTDSAYKLVLKELKIHKNEFTGIMRVGLPAGLQGTLFSFSNMLIQSSINSFGSVAMAGNSAGGNIEGFVYMAMNSIYQTSLTYCAQNLGIKNIERIKKGILCCLALVSAIGLVLGTLAVLFSRELVSIYSPDPDVIEIGVERIAVICSLYFLCGIMDTLAGILRGLSYSLLPMIITLIGACGFRVLWIDIMFEFKRSLFTLYLAYPVSWTITLIALLISLIFVMKKLSRR